MFNNGTSSPWARKVPFFPSVSWKAGNTQWSRVDFPDLHKLIHTLSRLVIRQWRDTVLILRLPKNPANPVPIWKSLFLDYERQLFRKFQKEGHKQVDSATVTTNMFCMFSNWYSRTVDAIIILIANCKKHHPPVTNSKFWRVRFLKNFFR